MRTFKELAKEIEDQGYVPLGDDVFTDSNDSWDHYYDCRCGRPSECCDCGDIIEDGDNNE